MNELIIVFLSSVKFGMTFPLAIIRYEMGFFQTILWTNAGGFLGIVFFSYVSNWIIRIWRKYFQKAAFPNDIRMKGSGKKRKLFTNRNRQIVKIKSKYGLVGIASLTPIVFSIPLGTFLAIRYFRNKKKNLLYLSLSNFIWSIIYTSFYTFCYDIYLSW